jgi:hypothetical protein
MDYIHNSRNKFLLVHLVGVLFMADIMSSIKIQTPVEYPFLRNCWRMLGTTNKMDLFFPNAMMMLFLLLELVVFMSPLVVASGMVEKTENQIQLMWIVSLINAPTSSLMQEGSILEEVDSLGMASTKLLDSGTTLVVYVVNNVK